MLRKTTLGAMRHFQVKSIYKFAKFTVDALVSSGKISAAGSEKEWARIVVKEMGKIGLTASKNILKKMR